MPRLPNSQPPRFSWWRRAIRYIAISGLVLTLLGALTIAAAYWYVEPKLPSVASVRTVPMQVPLKIFSAEGKLIASFGETRRKPVLISEIPQLVRQAFIAVEDGRFYDHHGLDPLGIARALWEILTTGEKGSGGSTITQQLARNIYLTPEKTYERKLIEMFLALRLERELSKDEILALYLNKIFLGQRAYGVAAAAEVYYGKSLAQLSLPEAAMLAALPKAPSELNPIHNPKGAVERRNYVLQRMAELGHITPIQSQKAQAEADYAALHNPAIEVYAPYVAEMARIEAEQILGSEVALTGGFQVFTSIDARLQAAANLALEDALKSYDQRHGWRGPEGQIDPALLGSPAELDRALEPYYAVNGLVSAVVVSLTDNAAVLHLGDGQDAGLELSTAKWARRYRGPTSMGPTPKRLGDVLKPGDVVRVSRTAEGSWQLSQIPLVQGAFVAMDPENGALRALVGGFSFARSKFNRATQSMRPPGSSFKPFIYSAALEKGFTTASIINDAPLVFEDSSMDGVWKPQNDNEKFNGPTRLREAMVTSRNLVSVRVLDAIGVPFARRYIQQFGFPATSLPPNLSLALGTSATPPIAMARGYAAFANAGFLVQPHLISRIEDIRGKLVHRARTPRACRLCPERLEHELTRIETAQQLVEASLKSESAALEGTESAASKASETPQPIEISPELILAPRAIDERNAYIINTMMRDVVKRGTGHKAMELGRNDLAGKTGTTNEHRDAWFSGFSAHMVATAWVGFDDFSTLGEGEFGAKAALPIWMDFMRVALAGQPEELLEQPTGITTARINGRNGLLTSGGDPGAIMEVFRNEDLGKLGSAIGANDRNTQSDPYEVF